MKLSIQTILKGYYKRCDCGCICLVKIIDRRGGIRRYLKNHDKKGKSHWNFKNNRSIERDYIRIRKPHYPYSINGYVRQHRYIMYIYLSILNGKPTYLSKYDDVHHRNNNKQDNRIENLQLISHENHSKYHNPIIDKSNRICNLCNINIDNHWMNDINGFLCLSCYMSIKYFRKKFG